MYLGHRFPAATFALLAAAAGIAPGALAQLLPRDCVFSAAAEPGDTCKSMAEAWFITESQFKSYNPGVNCAGLTAGREYCVEWTGKLPPTVSVPTTKISTTSTRSSTTRSSSISTKTPTTTTTTTTSAPAGPIPVQDGIAKDCNTWHRVQSGDTCQKIVDKYKTFTLTQLYSWNPAVGTDCSSLWLDYYVCIGVKGGTGPTSTSKRTTTTTSTTTATRTTTASAGPTPTQPNVNNKCKKWHLVSSGDTCQKVADLNKITLAKFYEWNPDVGNACATMWLGYYVCVGI